MLLQGDGRFDETAEDGLSLDGGLELGDGPVVRPLDAVREVARRELTGTPVIGNALTAHAFLAASLVGAVAVLHVPFIVRAIHVGHSSFLDARISQ